MFAHVLASVLLATTTLPAKGEVKPATAAASVRATALPTAQRLRLTLGRPSCPTGVPNRPGTVFQCTVAMADAVVPYLVTVSPLSSLLVTQLWAVIPSTVMVAAAGKGARCGRRKAISAPPGSVLTCTVGTAAVRLRVSTVDGGLTPV